MIPILPGLSLLLWVAVTMWICGHYCGRAQMRRNRERSAEPLTMAFRIVTRGVSDPRGARGVNDDAADDDRMHTRH